MGPHLPEEQGLSVLPALRLLLLEAPPRLSPQGPPPLTP